MLNAEKYKKEILDITQKNYYFAVSKDRQNIKRCCANLKCENCIFNGKDLRGCEWLRTKWLLSEYKEPIKLTRLEYEMLKWLDKGGYKFIVRALSDNLIAHNSKPKKAFDKWISENRCRGIFGFYELFQFVKWEDKEPTSIKDVLDNCEVMNDDTDKREE